MGSGEGLRLAKSDKLRGTENYIQWADEVKNILMSKGLEEYIIPSFKKPLEVETTDKALYTVRQNEI